MSDAQTSGEATAEARGMEPRVFAAHGRLHLSNRPDDVLLTAPLSGSERS